MAGVTKADIPHESEKMGMLWTMIKEFYIPEDNDEFWLAVIRRTEEIDQKCHSRLGQKLMVAFADYLEEKQKDMGETGNGQKLNSRDCT